jgi:hypothetical protein
MDFLKIEHAQRALCSRFGAAFVSTTLDDKMGFAGSTSGLNPINGLRHLKALGTSGWYIWCGEAFSESADFFEPQHAKRIYESLTECSPLIWASTWLSLSVGRRFRRVYKSDNAVSKKPLTATLHMLPFAVAVCKECC